MPQRTRHVDLANCLISGTSLSHAPTFTNEHTSTGSGFPSHESDGCEVGSVLGCAEGPTVGCEDGSSATCTTHTPHNRGQAAFTSSPNTSKHSKSGARSAPTEAAAKVAQPSASTFAPFNVSTPQMGTAVGSAVGSAMPFKVGCRVGSRIGLLVGSTEGCALGCSLGCALGCCVGDGAVAVVGLATGSGAGADTGVGVGADVSGEGTVHLPHSSGHAFWITSSNPDVTQNVLSGLPVARAALTKSMQSESSAQTPASEGTAVGSALGAGVGSKVAVSSWDGSCEGTSEGTLSEVSRHTPHICGHARITSSVVSGSKQKKVGWITKQDCHILEI